MCFFVWWLELYFTKKKKTHFDFKYNVLSKTNTYLKTKSIYKIYSMCNNFVCVTCQMSNKYYLLFALKILTIKIIMFKCHLFPSLVNIDRNIAFSVNKFEPERISSRVLSANIMLWCNQVLAQVQILMLNDWKSFIFILTHVQFITASQYFILTI